MNMEKAEIPIGIPIGMTPETPTGMAIEIPIEMMPETPIGMVIEIPREVPIQVTEELEDFIPL